MKFQTIAHAFTFLLVALFPISAEPGSCYSYPVGGEAPGALSTDLEADYQMRFDYAQNHGTDMQKWQDTAMFAFKVVFQSVGSGGQVTGPKDTTKPDPRPVDTLSPLAFKAWAQVLFTNYAIYDYSDPTKRLSTPVEPSDTFTPLLGTRTTMLGIGHECFTRVVDPGTPGHPINLVRKVSRISSPEKTIQNSTYNVMGRNSGVFGPSPFLILFKK